MKNFENSKLKKKFYMFSAILIVALIFTGIYSLILMGIINSKSTAISSNWLPSVILAEELNTATSNFRIAEISHVVASNPSHKQIYEASLFEISTSIENMFTDYEKNCISSDIDLALIEQSRRLWDAYLGIHDRLITFSIDNDIDSAMNIMENESEVLFFELSSVFATLVSFNTDSAQVANSVGDDLYSSTYIIIAAIIVLAFLVTIQFKTLIFEIEVTQRNLAHSNEEAMLSSQAKSNFLANMSHEIRTPMNAISGMIDIILRETTDNNVVEYAQNIKRACDSLLFIINDVLDFSKIESGKLDIYESSYSLENVLKDVLTIANSRLEHKDLMFIANFAQDLPQNIIGDEVRVKQIMVNILNNAIKFTHEGHISFDVFGELNNGELTLTFSITDTGVGISNDSIEKLFEEFERVDTKKNRNIEGTGLGLAISKRLATMMGGEIIVESELGKGTVFTVIIKQKYTDYQPLAYVETPKSVLIFESRELYLNSIKTACEQLALKKVVSCSLQSDLNDALVDYEFDYIFTCALYLNKVQELLTKSNMSTKIIIIADNNKDKIKLNYPTVVLPLHSIAIANILNGKSHVDNHTESYDNFIAPSCKILIVDDNHVNLIVAQGLMKPYKFTMETATNGEIAVDKIKNNKYDLVFMDHMMPVMDGIDATIMVRSLEGEYFQNLPIIALTANAIVGTQEMFIKEGMNDFLDKPIKVQRLNEVLKKWLPKKSQIVVEDTYSDDSLLELVESPQRISIENIDTNLGIERVGGDFDNYINILTLYHKDGLKRCDIIADFYEKKQFTDYKIEVHAIKSASASIGATELSLKASRLEDACIANDNIYINQNNKSFLDDFSVLLEKINNAIKEFIPQEDNDSKELGDTTLLSEMLPELKEALDNIDINACDEILDKLLSFQWVDNISNNLNDVKDFVLEYEYDDAIVVVDTILKEI